MTFGRVQPRIGDDDRRALRARRGDVQPVQAVKKLHPPRRILRARRRHTIDDDRRVLPLKLVDGSDARARRQPLGQAADLRIEGRDDEDVAERELLFDALVVDPSRSRSGESRDEIGDYLYALPPEFEDLARFIRSTAPPRALLSAGFLGGLLGGVLASIAIGALASKALGARKQSTMVVGDVQPLMPRNGAEIAHSLLFATNAGFSEELFFRLLLPLLIAMIIGNALVAILASAVVFGLVHIYQGWVGVVATTILAVLLSALYLGTGSIWIAIVAHVLLDVVNLVVRPTLARLVAAR